MSKVEIITVHYKTPEVLLRMLKSLEKHEDNSYPIRIIDGSDCKYDEIEEYVKKHKNLSIEYFNYNIHHGPGLNYGISSSSSQYVLCIDSDVIVLRPVISKMVEKIGENYAVGIMIKLDDSITIKTDNRTVGQISYIHPSFMLLNRALYPNFYPFIKHGAPCILSMADIHIQGQSKKLVDFPDYEAYMQWGRGGTREKFGSCLLGIHHRSFEIISKSNIKRVKPVFSVLIPTFYRPDLVKRAIQSVLVQSFEKFEIIVVDDGNDQETMEAVNSFNDKRIKYVVRKINGGPAAARNTGIKNASGNFICFLDDDDEYLPDMLLELYNMFEADAELGFVWTGISRLEQNNGRETEFRRNVWPRYFDDREEGLAMASSIATSFGLCIKKSCFDEVGLLDENLPFSEDTDLAIRLAKSCKFGTVPKILVKIYRHDSGQLSSMRFHIRNLEIYQYIINKHYHFLSQHPKAFHMHLKAFAKICYRLGKKNLGRKMYLSLILKYPYYRLFYADLLCFEFCGTHYAEWKRERNKTKKLKK